MPRLTPEERATIADRYLAGENCPAIAVDLGCSPSAVWSLLRRRGVPCRSMSEAKALHPLNHEAFHVLTPEAVYWCGFLEADGHIGRPSKESPRVSIKLAAKDKGHLVKFRDFLGSGHKISECQTESVFSGDKSYAAVRFCVNSRKIADRLEGLGVKRGPVSPELVVSPDFWRGVVDGDGSIGICSGRAWFKVVGREELLIRLQYYLATHFDSRVTVRPGKGIHGIGTTGYAAGRIIEHLYAGALVGLERKVDTARRITEQARLRQAAKR